MLRLSLPPAVALRVEPGGCDLLAPGRHLRLAGVSLAVQGALGLLRGGAGEAALFAPLDARARVELRHCLDLIEQEGLLLRVLLDSRRQATLATRRRPGLAPRREPLPKEASIKLSRFALARADRGALLLESPCACGRLWLQGPEAASALAVLAAPIQAEDAARRLPGLSAGAARELLALLWRAGLLVRLDEGGDPEAQGAIGLWEFHDRLFHERSRLGDHPAGKLPRPPAPPAPRPPALATLALPEAGSGRAPTLDDALRQRRSTRRFDARRPLSLAHLGELLARAAREIPRHPGPPRPPYPSAGGLYPLHLYLIVERCDDLAPGLYRYDRRAHALDLIAEPSGLLRAVVSDAVAATGVTTEPQVLLVLVADLAPTLARYRGLAYAALLKEAGALMHQLSLVASAMGLGACMLGAGDSAAFSGAAGLDPWRQPPVGELLVGTLPPLETS